MSAHARFSTCIGLASALLISGGLHAQDLLPGLDSLPAGQWSAISLPPEQAFCSDGSPYQFSVRPGDSDHLTIYFQGGGACWDLITCNVLRPFDATVSPNEVAAYGGIFDDENPANPVAGDTTVFVPYCTGDVHIGDAVAFGTQFHGYQNAQAVLDWTYQNIPAPSSLFITGSSAGGYGAIFHAEAILDQYPDAQASVLADASIGITPPGWNGYQTWQVNSWLPDIDALVDAGVPVGEQLLARMAEAHPDVLFGQDTTNLDDVQIGFYGLQAGDLLPRPSGPNPERAETWQREMEASLMRLGMHDNFAAYVASGTLHTLLPRPEFFTLAEQGISFAEWLSDFRAGRAETVTATLAEVP